MYVLVKGDSTTKTSMSQDLSASQMIANDVLTLIKSDAVSKQTAEALKMKSLRDYRINVSSENTSRVISLTVTGEDAASTAIIANELAKNVSSVAQSVMDVQSVNVIDEAIPTSPSGPNRIMYTAVAFLAGLFSAPCHCCAHGHAEHPRARRRRCGRASGHSRYWAAFRR